MRLANVAALPVFFDFVRHERRRGRAGVEPEQGFLNLFSATKVDDDEVVVVGRMLVAKSCCGCVGVLLRCGLATLVLIAFISNTLRAKAGLVSCELIMHAEVTRWCWGSGRERKGEGETIQDDHLSMMMLATSECARKQANEERTLEDVTGLLPGPCR